MLKQILGKLPKKPSAKFWDNGESLTPDITNQGDNENQQNSTSHQSSSSNGDHLSFEVLPRLRDVSISEKQELFLKKLRLCCLVFDFVDEPQRNLKEKEIKRQTLLEVVDYVLSSGNAKFPESVIQEATKMVSLNLFCDPNRQWKSNKAAEAAFDLGGGGEEEEGSLNPSWPHLQIVYEFLLRIVASPNTDAKISKKYMDHTFVLKLLDLFDSEDPREREYLKTILHRIYGRFMVHRPFIRKTMNNILYDFIFETGKHSGIAEFLEVLGSIINGFALPLKEEHKLFLTRVLVPLHKLKCLPNYHQQLSYCVIQFVEKDCKLADTVIRGLLKYWPVTNSSKEIMFLNELEEILEATQLTEFERCMIPLSRQIAQCLSSSHFQVAERALYLWNNDHVSNLVRPNSRVILPIVFPALERNGSSHWNQAVKNLTENVLKVLSDTNPDLFEECLRKFQEDQLRAEDSKKKNGETWRQLEEIVASKRHTSMAKLILITKRDLFAMTTLGQFFLRRFHKKCLRRVEVISRDIIKPSSPTPNHLKSFKLSLLEQLGPTIFGPMVFLYSGNNRTKLTEKSQKLKKSLSETLTHFYPLAGRLHGNVSIDCNDSGADFLEAEVNSPLSSLLQEPSSDILQQLIPTSVDSMETRTKLFLAQASFFECGGMAIGVCVSHKLADATSIGLFMKSWAAITSRGSIQTVGSPVFDSAAKIFPPGNFSESSPAPVVEPEIMMNQTLSKRFVFDSSSIEALQAKASSFEVEQPTRVEAVSALIWKTAMEATRRVSGTSKPSILACSASLRSRLSPPFTKNSIGNLVSYFAAKAEEGKLQALVSEIRKARQRFENSHVPKLVGNPNATEIICDYQREAGDMIASGDYEFFICTSVCRFGLYEIDFGWGEPVWVGLPSVRQKNIVALLDTKEAGEIEAWVNLNEREMGFFEEDRDLLRFGSVNPSVFQPFLHVL